MHGLFARCHAGDVILYLWSRSRFTYLSAVLGEACLVEVGQGIRLLRGEPTPRLLCEERSLKAAAWCRIFILLPQSRLLSSLFYSVNIPLFLFLFFFFLHPQRPFFSCVVTRAPLSLWVGKQQMLKTSGIIITIKSTIRPKAQHEIVSPNKNHFVILRLHVVHCLHVPSLVYCDSSPHTPSWCHECSPEHQTWINLLLKIVPNKHRDYFPWENHQHAAVLWTFGIFFRSTSVRMQFVKLEVCRRKEARKCLFSGTLHNRWSSQTAARRWTDAAWKSRAAVF